MSPAQTSQAGELSPNLIPSFSDPSASMVVARITGRQASQGVVHEPGTETGSLLLAVVQIIHSDVLHPDDSIFAPFERVADPQIRRRNQFNAWNSLSLEPGALLLLVVKPQRPPIYTALAASPLSSPNDPEIAAALDCYHIESVLHGNPSAAKLMLLNALQTPSDLSRFYALDVITQRHALSREDSSLLVTAALKSGKVPAPSRQDLGFHLASGNLFDPKRGADPINGNIVTALATQMVASSDRKSRDQWLKFLSSCVSRQFSADTKIDRETRLALVRSVRDPTPQQVISALDAAVREAPAPEFAKPAKRLLDAWRNAFGSPQ